MLSRRSWLTLVGVTLMACHAVAYTDKSVIPNIPIGNMSSSQIEDALQQCPLVQALIEHKHATQPPQSGFTQQLFSVLFPSSPAINALLATLYISGPPNFLLALCPPNIDPNSLSVMVAFAVGGLMGDTLFHLLPEIFLGEEGEGVRFVKVEGNKNLLLGVAIMCGFVTFVAMDKGVRILSGGEGHSHDHAHSHNHAKETTSAITSGTDKASNSARSRKSGKASANGKIESKDTMKEMNPSVKLSGYLNLLADFTHNITDGLALSSSFYASPTIGATTTMAVFFHEIPHEVGDFALLIQSGFSKQKAMAAQFVTAIGAFLGTLIGIFIQEFGGNSAQATTGPGLFGTDLRWGDLLLPFTAGTFLYVGTVAVIPEMLETGSNKTAEVKKILSQFAAMAVGAGIMIVISWD